jgi:hypothetical protein
MRAWAADRPIAILANNDVVSAARDLRSGATGITFWRAGAIDGIQSNAPAVVFMSSSNLRTMRVDVANPNAGVAGTIELTIPGRWLTRDVPSVRQSRSTTLLVPRNGGRTTTVTLERIQPRRRAG